MNLRPRVGRAGLLVGLVAVVACGTAARRNGEPLESPKARAPSAIDAAPGPDVARDGGAPTVSFANVFLGNVTVERGGAGAIGGSAGARLAIEGDVGRPGSAEIELRGLAPVRAGNKMELVIASYPMRKDAPRERDRAASFVVDFDTSAVKAVRASAVGELGEKPSMADLARFVSAYIEKKNLTRGYDIASVVARRREGDCSEHAVLLAALGRSFGHSARVVHGLVFIDAKSSLFGAMHAWVEWHDGKGWLPADGAIGQEHDPLYLPLQVLEDEAPSFGRSLLLAASHEIRVITVAPREPR